MNLFKEAPKMSDEQFKDALIQLVRAGIAVWEHRRVAIANDPNFNPANYARVPQESGLVCNLCAARKSDDPLKMSEDFGVVNKALETGDRAEVLKAIDTGIAKARTKAKELWGVEL